jgi:hypothetical protein
MTWLRDRPRLLIGVPGSKEWKERWPDKLPFSKLLLVSALHGMHQADVRTHNVKVQIVEVTQESSVRVAHKFCNALQ